MVLIVFEFNSSLFIKLKQKFYMYIFYLKIFLNSYKISSIIDQNLLKCRKIVYNFKLYTLITYFFGKDSI